MAEVKSGRVDATFNYGEVLTPYSQAGQGWDRKIGHWRDLAFKWRAVCLSILGVNVLLTLLFFALLSGPQQQIWLAQINQSGFVERGGWLRLDTPVPVTAAKHFLTSYLLSLDARSAKEQEFAKRYTDPKVWPAVAELRGNEQDIEIDRIKVLGQDRFQLTWHTGNRSSQAVEVSLKRVEPGSEAILMQNPFGYIVTEIKLVGKS